ncbi:hypothetical protein TCAL_05672, partial [Tigriopus californicus]
SSCSFTAGFGIHCYVDNTVDGVPAQVIDCSSLGIQREELYCRNTTTDKGEIHRSCVAMSWYDSNWEQLGCHFEHGIKRCTCSTDLCNAPFASTAAFSKSPSVLCMGQGAGISILMIALQWIQPGGMSSSVIT